MAALLHPLGAGRQIAIDRAVVLIGRSAECDVVLDFSSRISRIHCAIVQVDSDYYLRDLGSMNGVWIGSQRIVREQKLQNGVEVSIGDVRFLFLDNVTVVPRPPQPSSGHVPQPVQVVQTPGSGSDVTSGFRPRPETYGAVSGSDVTIQQSAGSQASPDVPEYDVVEVLDDDDGGTTIRPAAAESFDEVEVLVDLSDDGQELFGDLELIEDVEVIEEVEIIDDEPLFNPDQRSGKSQRKHRP